MSPERFYDGDDPTPQTETLDKLYLEWSQFTGAKTARELQLEAQLESVRNCKYVIVNGMEFCLRDDIKAAIGEGE